MAERQLRALDKKMNDGINNEIRSIGDQSGTDLAKLRKLLEALA